MPETQPSDDSKLFTTTPRLDVERSPEREKLATKLLLDLIKIPSVTNTERECEPVDVLKVFFEKYGEEYGITCRVIEAGGKRNFVAEVGNEDDGPSVLLNAHFDVVPADKDMFSPKIEDGVIYGRGACDDKGGLVAMAVAMVEIAKAGEHSGKVFFCAVNSEEEYTPYGTEACLEERIVAEHVIVAEPTSGEVVVGHGGQANFVVKVEGTSAHSSMPGLGRNAIHRLDAVARRLKRKLRVFHDPRWLKPQTCTVTGTGGGGVSNVVPGSAEATFNVRAQKDPEKIFDQIEKTLSKLKGVSLTRGFQAEPCVFKENSDLVRAALRVTGQQKAVCVPWRSEGVEYNKHPFSKDVVDGIIVYGPGNIKYAHGPDEQIEIADMVKAITDYQEIIKLCQDPSLTKK